MIIHDEQPERAPRYRGVSYTTPIDAAKEAVPIIDLADLLCGPGGFARVHDQLAYRYPAVVTGVGMLRIMILGGLGRCVR